MNENETQTFKTFVSRYLTRSIRHAFVAGLATLGLLDALLIAVAVMLVRALTLRWPAPDVTGIIVGGGTVFSSIASHIVIALMLKRRAALMPVVFAQFAATMLLSSANLQGLAAQGAQWFRHFFDR